MIGMDTLLARSSISSVVEETVTTMYSATTK